MVGEVNKTGEEVTTAVLADDLETEPWLLLEVITTTMRSPISPEVIVYEDEVAPSMATQLPETSVVPALTAAEQFHHW
jgi:hypothetical protein